MIKEILIGYAIIIFGITIAYLTGNLLIGDVLVVIGVVIFITAMAMLAVLIPLGVRT